MMELTGGCSLAARRFMCYQSDFQTAAAAPTDMSNRMLEVLCHGPSAILLFDLTHSSTTVHRPVGSGATQLIFWRSFLRLSSTLHGGEMRCASSKQHHCSKAKQYHRHDLPRPGSALLTLHPCPVLREPNPASRQNPFRRDSAPIFTPSDSAAKNSQSPP